MLFMRPLYHRRRPMADRYRTPSGEPTAEARKKFGLPDGSFPVWDKPSAEAAVSLLGRLSGDQLRNRLKRIAIYLPTQAHEAYQRYKKEGKL